MLFENFSAEIFVHNIGLLSCKILITFPIYVEEIIQTRKCMWISPDGRYLAFATFNDSAVGEFKYPVFKTNHQYPEIFSLSYPKVCTYTYLFQVNY